MRSKGSCNKYSFTSYFHRQARTNNLDIVVSLKSDLIKTPNLSTSN